ncbi:MAG: hypothetical protein A2Y56_10595 [Candidatus Aminicenantes bacterium RBG_13_63_10]|nr:MAG: hypothetical protein A2Y56_10595 [Candidatus Aminicenantes bacterium RBG_13_63_10]
MPTPKSLAEIKSNAAVRVVSIEGGRGVRQRLFALGFHIGDRVVLQGHGPFRGPLLVNNLTTGTCLAVGRGIAQRIQVEAEDDA